LHRQPSGLYRTVPQRKGVRQVVVLSLFANTAVTCGLQCCLHTYGLGGARDPIPGPSSTVGLISNCHRLGWPAWRSGLLGGPTGV